MSKGPIINARDNPMGDMASALPDVAGAIQEVLQPTTLVLIKKEQVDGYTKEIRITCDTKASIQPLTPQQLAIKPEGQRAWRWFTMFVLSNVDLQPDEGFVIDGLPCRIMAKTDWKKFGYIRYEILEDYNLNAPDESHSS